LILAPSADERTAALGRWFVLVTTMLAMTGAGARPMSARTFRIIEGAAILALIVLWITCVYQRYGLGLVRVTGYHRNPNFLAAALLPPVVYLGERALNALGRQSRSSFWIYGTLLLLVVHSLLLTGTRTALPVLGVYLLATMVRVLRLPWASATLRFGLGAGATVLAALVVVFASRFNSRLSVDYMLSDAAILSRFEIWRLNWELFLNSPWWGTGFMQNYLAVADHPSLQVHMDDSVKGLLAHNTYLQVLTESGAVGLFLFGAFFVTLFAKVRPMRWFVITIAIAGIADTMLHLNRAQPSLLFYVTLTLIGTLIWKPHSEASC
jgi:O-antigen ligase